MKAHGIVKGNNIVLEKISDDKKLTEGSKVEVIILPLKKKKHLFSTFKLGIKKEYLTREKIYAKN